MSETPATYSIEQQVTQALADAYPEPSLGTKEEAVRAALKAHRTLSRIKLSSREPSVTGKALSEYVTWLLDVWCQAQRALTDDQRRVVELYYMTDRPGWPRKHDGAECAYQCVQHYGNREVGRALGMGERQVARLKRQAVDIIVGLLWPG